jgi:hypothetical protein
MLRGHCSASDCCQYRATARLNNANSPLVIDAAREVPYDADPCYSSSVSLPCESQDRGDDIAPACRSQAPVRRGFLFADRPLMMKKAPLEAGLSRAEALIIMQVEP